MFYQKMLSFFAVIYSVIKQSFASLGARGGERVNFFSTNHFHENLEAEHDLGARGNYANMTKINSRSLNIPFDASKLRFKFSNHIALLFE